MASVLIRNLDDEVVARLKRRASANNRSLEGELRQLLSEASQDQLTSMRADFIEFARGFQARTMGRDHTPAETLIRASREADHGE